MKIKSTTYLIALILLGSITIPVSAHADITQTDASDMLKGQFIYLLNLFPARIVIGIA